MKSTSWTILVVMCLSLLSGMIFSLSPQTPQPVSAQAAEQQGNEPESDLETSSHNPQRPDSSITANLTVGSAPCQYATINAALSAANPGDRLLLEGGVTFYEYLSIQKDISLIGGYAGCGSGSDKPTTLHGSYASRVIYIYPNLVITLENLRITGGVSPSILNGGGMLVRENTTLTGNNLEIYQNTGGPSGGGIQITGGIVTFTDTYVYSNSALSSGGGINVDNGGRLYLRGKWEISNNVSGNIGGGLAVSSNSTAELRATTGNCKIFQNEAVHGGAIHSNSPSDLKLYAISGHSLEISENFVSANGGGLYGNGGGLFDLYGQIVVSGNRAPEGNGGAIYLTNDSEAWLDDYVNIMPQVFGNWAHNGGAIYAVNSPLVRCDGAIFGREPTGNLAVAGHGGAVYLDTSIFESYNCIYFNNQAAAHGGAIYAFDSDLVITATYGSNLIHTEIELERNALDRNTIHATACNPQQKECSSFYNNIADDNYNNLGDGGAIYNSYSEASIDLTYFHHNSAYRGGAIYQSGATASTTLTNSLVHHNSVVLAFGAGIRREGGTFNLSHVTIADNSGGAGFSGNSNSVSNSIAWGNDSGFTLSPVSSSCNIDQSNNAGMSIDPQFVNPGDGENYYLKLTSPAINACSTGSGTSLNNIARPLKSGYDMGAYEILQDVIYLPLITR